MPTLPAPLAGTAERWFGRPAAIADVENLSPGLRRVTFAGDALRGRSFRPGQEVEFLVNDRDFRHYTPASFDSAGGRFDVVFTDHGEGPGAAWFRGLRPGDDVAVMGPGGGLRRRGGDARTLLLGDATTLGLFAALTRSREGDIVGAVEVPAPDVEAATALVPALTVVPTGSDPGSAILAWAAANYRPAATDGACLAGHAQTIQQLRARLRTLGMSRSNIITKPYWSTNRAGL